MTKTAGWLPESLRNKFGKSAPEYLPTCNCCCSLIGRSDSRVYMASSDGSPEIASHGQQSQGAHKKEAFPSVAEESTWRW